MHFCSYLSSIHRSMWTKVTCYTITPLKEYPVTYGEFIVDVVAVAVIVCATFLFFAHFLLHFKSIKYENHSKKFMCIVTTANRRRNTQKNKKKLLRKSFIAAITEFNHTEHYLKLFKKHRQFRVVIHLTAYFQ